MPVSMGLCEHHVLIYVYVYICRRFINDDSKDDGGYQQPCFRCSDGEGEAGMVYRLSQVRSAILELTSF